MYSCYKLTNNKGKQLILKSFPNFDFFTVLCDHITYQFPSNELPPALESVEVIGVVKETGKVLGLLLNVNGSRYRPDGKSYHITVAVGNKVPAKYTNEAIEQGKFNLLNRPITLDPSWFSGVIQE